MLTGVQRHLWQRLLWWKFRLFQQHRHQKLVLEWVEGRPLLVLPGVMNPALFRTGPFLAQYLTRERVAAGRRVLDLGTGSGLLALTAAAQGAQVVAVDINPEAVRCTRLNVLLNRAEVQVEVCEGDLFGPLAGQQFDLVLCNPPFFGGAPDGGFDIAWRSDDFAGRFAEGLKQHLAAGGQALVVLSSQGAETAFLETFAAHGFATEVTARNDLKNEVLTIYRLTTRKDETA